MKKLTVFKAPKPPRLAGKSRSRLTLKKSKPERTSSRIVRLPVAETMADAAPALVPRDIDAAEPIAAHERMPYDGNTAFNLYLREVGETKLLTVEEENMLAARIKKGDKKARERMIKANLRLVVKIAREY